MDLLVLHNLHLAVIEYLHRGRRAVPLQTFTTDIVIINCPQLWLCQPLLLNAPRKQPNSVK